MSYQVDENGHTVKKNKDGSFETLANFSATITRETRYTDGQSTATVLTIEGKQGDETFPETEVPAEKFAGLTWVLPAWGVSAVLFPGNNVKEEFRTFVQVKSKPLRETIYTHTGWTSNGKGPVFLHNGGAITASGDNTSQRVLLPPELRRFKISAAGDPREATRATLGLTQLGPKELMYPVLAAIIAPLHGPVDFALHLAGRTGTFKSELASLAQSHYGCEMDARHLPGSWSSTANALEAQAFRAKNCLFCVDDFIPSGTTWQQKAYQKTADQVIRGQGNQAGRARLTDTSNHQETMFPRGMIFSTGEDTPEGHSIRARTFIIELSPDDIQRENLTAAQATRHLFPLTTGHYVHYLAKSLSEYQQTIRENALKLRDEFIDIGHTRTPTTVARLIASLAHFIEYAAGIGAIAKEEAAVKKAEAYMAITKTGEKQAAYLLASDPCEAFCEAIRTLLNGHISHLRTKDGGIPRQPEILGWTKETSQGDLPTFASHGTCLGWCDWDNDELYIDIAASFHPIRKHANGQITFTRQTMVKRLKDAGLLTRVDGARQRNTIRVICENHARQVIAMPMSQVLELNEKPTK